MQKIFWDFADQSSVKQSDQDIYGNYKQLLFQGLDKLKNHQVRIHTDPDVKPVIQPVRRLPFSNQEEG